ncbi:MAG: endonuclease III [bacterium]|jgi:endonuclease-3
MAVKDWKSAPAKERAKKVIEELKKYYEDRSGLNHNNPFELLVATILSAQCRDERVNQVTPALFEKYPDARALADAPLEEVDETIRTINFHSGKSRNIIAASQVLVEKYLGEVPADMDALTQLPGVGRKTANVVLGTAFNLPAITVDTHFRRVSSRLEFTQNTDPDKIEQDIIKIIPPREQTGFSHRLIWHGRKVCFARKPDCSTCGIAKYCPSEGRA